MTDKSLNTYTVKEAAKVLKISPGTLRQWEKELNGLLVIPRSKQGARYYTEDEISLLETVKQMRDKNLSKDMIRTIIEESFLLKKEAVSNHQESSLININSEAPFQQADIKQNIDQFMQSIERLKSELVDEIKNEVKKEVSKGSVHIVKNLSDSIYKSNEKIRAEIEEKIRGLSNRITDSSDAQAEEFKTMIHYISSSAEVTHTEITSLIDTLNTDRETYIAMVNREREEYWKDVNRRELVFQDLLTGFRNAAASEDKKKSWWKIWR